MSKTIKDVLDWYYYNLPEMKLIYQLEVLKDIAKKFTGVEFDFQDTKDDRETLEVIQEVYSFIYCVLKGLEYGTFKAWEHLEEDKYLNWIAEYKMEHFSEEIFKEFGLEIVEKSDKGIKVLDKGKSKVLN